MQNNAHELGFHPQMELDLQELEALEAPDVETGFAFGATLAGAGFVAVTITCAIST
ncbi:hypothetical protein ACFQ71_23525 [Streptomyces sp. NPDC056534]|uniref:hypothetical protein n=1 Tax=Streptomyces sp. NPDC056534 TaxID=3345857 RepID=UPI0036CDAF7A